MISILQEARIGKDAVYLVVLIHIEVTGDDHGCALRNLADTAHDQFGGFMPCHYAHVVHVKVEEVECFVVGSRLAGKLTPRADAHTGGVPSQPGTVGRLAEPEVTLVEQAQPVYRVDQAGHATACATPLERQRCQGT